MTAARKFLAELVVARCDAPEVLELVEEALDQVALPVEFAIDGALDLAVALGWDVSSPPEARPDR